MTTFKRKRIDVTITLGVGQYGETLGDSATLTGYRVQAQVQGYGGESQTQAAVRIWGVPVDMMNRLTTIGAVNGVVRGKNTVMIAAGDEDGPLSVVYSGGMISCVPNLSSTPDVSMDILGLSAIYAAAKPVQASSYAGAVQVSDIMADFAKEAGYAFENNGVQVTLDNPYFPGTTLDKIKACARAADIPYYVDNGVLAIWPAGGVRKQSIIPVISPETGMVGYPSFNDFGVALRTVFQPNIRLGGQFEVRGSQIEMANGPWGVWTFAHNLESQTPNGAWFTDVAGSKVNVGV